MKTDKAKITKANYDLQKKVGSGPIEPEKIQASQNVIEKNEVDFEPMALAILARLRDGLEQAQNPAKTMQDMKEILTPPVMELKANAAIFHHALVGELAAVMLSFLENIQILDQDAYDIALAHQNSQEAILTRKIIRDGDAAGAALVEELKQACQRYYNKKFPN